MLTIIAFVRAEPPMGSMPDTWERYDKNIDQIAGTFKCFDGKKVIPLSAINDNYRDCQDGSDEPGTALGPPDNFYCKFGSEDIEDIPRWSVGDGICDCCDGSDEQFNSRVKCNNTCVSIDKKRSHLLKQLVDIYELGFQKKEEMIAKANKLHKIDLINKDKIDEKIKKVHEKISDFDVLLERNHQYHEESSFEKIFRAIHRFTFGKMTNQQSIIELMQKELSSSKEMLLKEKNRMELISKLPPDVLPYFYNDHNLTNKDYRVDVTMKFKDRFNSFGILSEFKKGKFFYEDGDNCYITKAPRHATAEPICWSDTKLVSVKEVRPCFLHAVFATPLACSKEAIDNLYNLTLAQLREIDSMCD